MLLPRTHVWTSLQRRLIIGAGLIGLMCFAMLVYSYERYHRGPTESAFVGIWGINGSIEDPLIYIEFRANHTFSMSTSPRMDDEEGASITGRWYAGGPNMYISLNPYWTGESGHRPWVWQIMEIKPDEFRVRDSDVKVFRRVHPAPPRASNPAMERTADRFVSIF
jgi:hypothetical protein